MENVVAWLKRRRSLAAAVAGLYVVFRILRGVAGIGLGFGGFGFLGSAFDFLADNWLLAAAVLGVVFLLVFVTVRWLIDWLDNRERRKRDGESPASSSVS